MRNDEYPAELFGDHDNLGVISTGSIAGRQRKIGYDLGKNHAHADTGDWRNLTQAIADGEPIDFEKLDGRKVRMSCETTSIEAKLSRDDEFFPWGANAWNLSNDNDVNHLWGFFDDAWRGKYGWTLWLDGEIPMKKQTADELPFGTEFRGKQEGRTLTGVSRYVRVAGNSAQNLDRNLGNSNEYARNITVYEVLGMYGQKESE